MNFKPALVFALAVFGPLLVTMILPLPCLGSNCALMALIYMTDPASLDASGMAGYCAWALAPLFSALGLFTTGVIFYLLFERRLSSWPARIFAWGIFTFALYLTAWYGITILTSIGASDKDPFEFLAWTALMAALLSLLAQVLVIPWLRFVVGVLASRVHFNTLPENIV